MIKKGERRKWKTNHKKKWDYPNIENNSNSDKWDIQNLIEQFFLKKKTQLSSKINLNIIENYFKIIEKTKDIERKKSKKKILLKF